MKSVLVARDARSADMPVFNVRGEFDLLIDADDYDAAMEAAFDGVEIRDRAWYVSEPVLTIYEVSRIR